MSIRIPWLMVACAAWLVLATSGTATARPRPGETTGDDLNTEITDFPPPDLPPQAPSGYVIVEEGLWSQHHDQPAGEFMAAQQEFLKDEVETAAESIRRGASYVRAEGSRAQAGDRDALLAASNALELLAGRVERRDVTSIADIEPVFAQAHRAVATHHLNLALLSESQGDAGHTGMHLAVAAYNVHQQMIWQNQELDVDLHANLDDVEKVAIRLQRHGEALDAEARQALSDLDQIIDSHPLAR